MNARGLIIFDAFNTLVTARQGYTGTFLAGLVQAGLQATDTLLARFQTASEGFDHSDWSGSRQTYVDWATETLRRLGPAGADAALTPCIVPALEQLHQAPMVAMPGAETCLRKLRAAGFAIAVCSNWGWDLEDDLQDAGLLATIDILVTSAHIGVRKPHPQIYHATLDLAGFAAQEAVFVGDSLRTDALGPQTVSICSVLLTTVATETFSGQQARSLAEVSDLLIDGKDAVRAAEPMAIANRLAAPTAPMADRADYPEDQSDHSLLAAARTSACHACSQAASHPMRMPVANFYATARARLGIMAPPTIDQ